jgi:hypothetical protein
MTRAVVGGLAGVVAALSLRPCCMVPAVLAISGLGSTGLGQVALTYRPIFLAAGAVMLGTSLVVTFRREGGWFMKGLAAGATIAAFVLTASVMGGLG